MLLNNISKASKIYNLEIRYSKIRAKRHAWVWSLNYSHPYSKINNKCSPVTAQGNMYMKTREFLLIFATECAQEAYKLDKNFYFYKRMFRLSYCPYSSNVTQWHYIRWQVFCLEHYSIFRFRYSEAIFGCRAKGSTTGY